jgi:acylphosphatase
VESHLGTRPGEDAAGREGTAGGVHVLVSGHVQGVGFRYFVKQRADAAGLAGWVRNRHDGTVEAVLVGADAALQPVLDAIARGPSQSRVDDVVTRTALDEERRAAERPLALRSTVG